MADRKKTKTKEVEEESINLTDSSVLDDETPEADRIRTASKKIKLVRAFLLVITALFILGGFSIFRDDISLENFRYIIKYFDLGSSELSDGTEPILIDTDSSMVSGICRSGIAVLKTSSFEIYDYSGERVLNDSLTFTNPAMVISDRSILVFDIGGKTARVYNSYSMLHEFNFDYEITAADMNDSGEFCIAAGEKGYTAAIYVYNSDFERIYRWASGTKQVFDVSLAGDGVFSVCAVRSENGDFKSELIVIDTKKDKPIYTEELPGELLMTAQCTSDGRIWLLSDAALRIANPKNKKTESVSFKSESLKKYSVGTDYFAEVINTSVIGQNYRVDFFDKSLKKVYSFEIDSQILDIACYRDKFFVLTVGGFYLLDPVTESDRFIETDNDIKTVLPVSESSAALIGDERIAFSYFD